MTRLTALELFGFKSFADRTRFDFPAGITAVVGPNGSGKSNVVDAIKWVLGEQSVRSLRGRDMTDVIFAGSGGRKPLNAAEVSLIFDNADALLPVDAPQVQITRRVYRSGENEYLINGETSRLRDIRELFSGTGAATEAYSVIEQGRVDALLVASGRDRRVVFEEAAGITRFRARRTEALRRLERSEQNRQRLADIVGEVSSRLETVRHQAARARRWQQMTDRLRTLRLAAAAEDLAEVDAAVGRVDGTLSVTREEHSETEARAAAAAAAATSLAAAEAELQPRLESERAAVATDKARAAAAEATLAMLWTRRRELETEQSRLEEDLRHSVREQRAAIGAVDAARDEVAGIERESLALIDRLGVCEEAAAGSHEHATRARQAVIDRTTKVETLEQSRQKLQSDLDRAAARVDESHRVTDSWRTRIDTARLQQARLLESVATWEGTIASLSQRMTAVECELETLDVTQRERSEGVDAGWQALAGWQAKLEACRERRTMLEEMISRQEGFSDAARRLLADTDSSRSVPGLLGPLAHHVEADVTWAPLVDLALGSLGQALVVEELDDLVRWHAAWSATDESRTVLAAGGRIGFVSAQAVRAATDFAPESAPGVVGRLDRLVGLPDPAASDPSTPDSSSGGGQQIVARLLARVWVVARLADAVPFVGTAPPGTLFITQGGECLSAEGAFEIGLPGAATGLVARRSELKALHQRHDELTRTVAEAGKLVERLQTELAATRLEIRQAQTRKQQAAERIASSRAELDRTVREQAVAGDGLAGLEASLRDAERQAVDLAAIRDAAQAATNKIDGELADARQQLARVRNDIDTLDRSRSEVLDEIHRLRVDQATCGERLTRARGSVTDRLTDLESRRGDLENAHRRRNDLQQRRAGVDLDLLAATAAHAEAMVAAERSTVLLSNLAAEHETVAADRRAVNSALEQARSLAARLAERIHAYELEAGEARHRRARIVERIRDDYDIAIEDVVTQAATASAGGTVPAGAGAAGGVSDAGDTPIIPPNRGELDMEIDTLRRKLSTMTSVNMEALAESESLTERLTGLETQLADVTNAKLAIEQLVSRIDDESRRLLGETIETVRGHFRELFERVFGGGQADIVLEPGVDLLETSVEIVSRPPGKEPRSISLLSGGEKTMTCVALLLAIFRSRPSPFCVLDEVDAALDEANVDRFAGVLRDFLSSTQFIVVTHSKKTMAAADTLYGITQEESGVSKRISVRFESSAGAAALPARKAA
jgi:chromosome segregation protein